MGPWRTGVQSRRRRESNTQVHSSTIGSCWAPGKRTPSPPRGGGHRSASGCLARACLRSVATASRRRLAPPPHRHNPLSCLGVRGNKTAKAAGRHIKRRQAKPAAIQNAMGHGRASPTSRGRVGSAPAYRPLPPPSSPSLPSRPSRPRPASTRERPILVPPPRTRSRALALVRTVPTGLVTPGGRPQYRPRRPTGEKVAG